MKRILLIILLIFCMTLVFSDENNKKVFVVSFSSLEIDFNPLHSYTTTEAQVFTALYEGLVGYHPFTLEPVPAAASHWDISEDNKTYRFYLREGLRFWNGTVLTANDFKETWLKLLHPDENAEYSFLFDIIKGAKQYRTGKIKDADEIGIKVVSDTILEVELENPAGHLLQILSHHTFVPIHPEFLEKKEKSWNDFKYIHGNGPFHIIKKTKDEIVLAKNELYWDALNTKMDKIHIKLGQDSDVATQGFNNGEIHWIADDFNMEKIGLKEAIIFHPMYGSTYYFFNCTIPPMDNSKIRKALALLLPWEEIRKGMLFPSNTLVPRVSSYPEVEGISKQNIEESMRILKEEGFLKRNSPLVINIKIPEGVETLRIAEIMKKAWEDKLNVKVIINSFSYSKYYKELQKKDFTIGTISWIGDFPDPLTFLQMWTGDSNLNDASYKSDLYDLKINESMNSFGTKRLKILSEAEKMLLEDAAVLPINNSSAINLIDLDVIDGWFPNPLDIHPFKYLDFIKHRLIPGVVIR